MATLIASPLSRVQRNQRNDIIRRRREAIEELRRNGVSISPAWARAVDDPEPELPALSVGDIGRDDFVSAPDARPMREEDVNNVESLSYGELHERLEKVAALLGKKLCTTAYTEFTSGKPSWGANDLRWTLAPHELKKLAVLA